MGYTILPPVNETMPQTADLYTTVKNIAVNIPNVSGSPGTVATQYIQMFFGFLPPHGRLLAAGEEVTIFGTLQNWITRYTPNERARRSLETALSGIQVSQAGVAGYSLAKWGRSIGQSLQIISSPAVFVKDAGTAQVGKFGALNAATSFVTPCWDNTNFYDNPVVFKSGTNYAQGIPTFGFMPGWAGNTPASAFSGFGASPPLYAGNVSSGYGAGGAVWSGASIDAASLAKYFDTRSVPTVTQNPAVGGSGMSLLDHQLTDTYTPFTSSPFFRATTQGAAYSFPVVVPLPSNATSLALTLGYIYPSSGASVTIGTAYSAATGQAMLSLAAGNVAGTYHFNITATVTLKASAGGGTQVYTQACTLVVP